MSGSVAMSRTAALFCIVILSHGICLAQSLVPRAYFISPLHSNAITLTYTFRDGSILFDPALPLEDTSGRLSIGSLSYYHSFGLFGRSANIAATLPYVVGHFQGVVRGTQTQIYRSGLSDLGLRVSVNLMGGPAMELKEFASWRQKTLLGASISMAFPTGQYDPSKAINPGSNRMAFKPELGYSYRQGHWIFDVYGGAWLFATNSEYFSRDVTNTLSQRPMLSTELHISYDLKPGWWLSFDGNYWYGGRTTLNGELNHRTLQANSRIGATGSIRIGKHQTLKFSYANGIVIQIGGNFQVVSCAWQYSWIGKPD